jgi:flavin-dependent dehydrogenase
MGVVGTRPARDGVLLVGDAAGLVNPLQGEGISQALASGQAAGLAILGEPGAATATYLRWIRDSYGDWASVTAPIHSGLVRHRRLVAGLGSALTAPVVGSLIASTWAIYWNDLMDGAVRTPAVAAARTVHRLGGIATTRSRLRRSLRDDISGKT